MTSWDTHLQDLTATGVWSREERELHLNSVEMKAAQLTINAFLPMILRELVILMSNNADLVCEIHSREEHLIGPVEPSRSGPSHRGVLASMGIWCHLWCHRSTSPKFVYYQSKCKTSFIGVSSSETFGKEVGCSSNSTSSLELSQCLHISPFALLSQVLLKVMLSTNLSLILLAPLGPQKEWFGGLLAVLVEEFVEHPLLWNLVVQPHIRKFHRGLEILQPHVWKLSSDSSARLALEKRSERLSLRTSGPQYALTRESSLDSSVGVMEGISLHVRPLFCRLNRYYICSGSWSCWFMLIRDIEPPLTMFSLWEVRSWQLIRLSTGCSVASKRHVHWERLSHQNGTCLWFLGALLVLFMST